MILRKIPFVNKKHYSPAGGLPLVAAEGGQRVCSKIQIGGAECTSGGLLERALYWSSSSEDDEYSDPPLEAEASAGARLRRGYTRISVKFW